MVGILWWEIGGVRKTAFITSLIWPPVTYIARCVSWLRAVGHSQL